ncbi:MAG TPA: DUF3168 domain-containing protein [Chryseosolibacter sp.]|nr:DUF3168 domain-containing protein [Chryseosolibacter sp.]
MSKGANAVLGILRDDATVSGIIENNIYRNAAPQGKAVPYIVVEEENTDPFPTKSGASAKDHVFVNVIYYSDSLETLDTLTEAGRAALDEKVAGTYNSVQVEQIRFQGQNDYDEEIENRTIYVVEQAYMVRVVR